MSEFQTITLVKQAQVATITLNRPDAANGMSLQLTTELAEAASECANDDAIKAVILTGAGRFFAPVAILTKCKALKMGRGMP